MRNEKIVTIPTGEQVKIEVILSFKIEELNKNYVAYTVNDHDSLETATVFISEIDSETNKLKDFDENDREVILAAYEEAKKVIFNNWKSVFNALFLFI